MELYMIDVEESLSELFDNNSTIELDADDVEAAVNICIDEGEIADPELFKSHIVAFFEAAFELIDG